MLGAVHVSAHSGHSLYQLRRKFEMHPEFIKGPVRGLRQLISRIGLDCKQWQKKPF